MKRESKLEENTSRIILDVTLRDGGYVNNWEFERETVFHVMDGLYDAGVRYIELGIMGLGGEEGKSTKFADFKQVEPLLARRKSDCHYAVMLTQTDADKFEIPPRSDKTVDLIRIAFFKREQGAAMEKVLELKDKGYEVFLQAMATSMYSDEELTALLDEVSRVKPAGFYIVDSFSTMYNEDVREMASFVLERLSPEIQFGFHAHNNIQMAYSNVIEFFSIPVQRPLMADGSIYGMGRGAGNVPTELLMEYLNKFCGTSYDILKVLELFQNDINPIFKEYFWGFSPTYYLTASKDMNSVYGWYLSSHGVSDIREMNEVLARIPPEIRFTLSRADADQAIQAYRKENGK